MADEKKVSAPAPEVKAPEAGVKKNKKISQMTMREVDEKLITVKEKMKHFDSRYAKELLKRKESLNLTK